MAKGERKNNGINRSLKSGKRQKFGKKKKKITSTQKYWKQTIKHR